MKIDITYQDYIDQVMAGKLPVCRLVRLAVERHVRDLTDMTSRGYYFDADHAKEVIKFFHLHPHIEGEWADRGELIMWEPWQQFIIASVYGWKRADGINRFTLAYVEIPRKNSKSTMAAVACSKALIFDKRMGAQIYTAATVESQAKIVWSMTDRMLKAAPYLAEGVVQRQKTISVTDTMSKYEPLGRDSDTKEGLNPYVAVIDEYHVWNNDDVFQAIRKGQGARKERLIFIITTGGFNKQGPCYRRRKGIIDILEGKARSDRTFGIIWTIDDPERWDDPEQWRIAHPNYDISVDPDFLQEEYEDAIRDGAEVHFKTKLLNLWGGSGHTWIDDNHVKLCNHGLDPDDLLGHECHGGLDLSSTDDFTVLSLLFKVDDIDRVLNYYWIPAAALKEKYKEFEHFRRHPRVIVTDGNTIDYNSIRHTITGYRVLDGQAGYDDDCLMNRYNIQAIEFDRFGATQIILDMKEADGLEDKLAPFGQGFVSMSAPTKEIKRLTLRHELDLMGDEILRWMYGNAAEKKDPAGNIKLDKEKSIDKIDGVVAMIMAKGGQMTSTPSGSIYDDPNNDI